MVCPKQIVYIQNGKYGVLACILIMSYLVYDSIAFMN